MANFRNWVLLGNLGIVGLVHHGAVLGGCLRRTHRVRIGRSGSAEGGV